MHDASGNEENAKLAYVKIRVDQLVEGDVERRQKRRRKRKKRAYMDRNSMSLMWGRRIIFAAFAITHVVVLFLMLFLGHTENDRWIDLS